MLQIFPIVNKRSALLSLRMKFFKIYLTVIFIKIFARYLNLDFKIINQEFTI